MNIPVNTVKSNLHPTQFQVVIPCYNCGEYIDQCLDSLLAQTFSNWTALVADDASTDTTVERVQPYLADPRMSLLASPERRYLMGNTLTALRSLDLGPREVVAILDGDDWIRPTCLEKIWEKHCQGYDFVYTDEDIQDQNYSFGGAILTSVPVRQQSWRFSHLRSFKAYLFRLLNDDAFRDARGEYFRAACDLALHLPMAELAGPEKVHFIREKLYHYRVHENCNFKVLRQEQLNNNWFIRSRPAEILQTMHFDFIETVTELSKHETDVLCKRVRDKYPSPFTVAVEHVIPQSEVDSWRAYHNLWIGNGIFLMSKEKSIGV